MKKILFYFLSLSVLISCQQEKKFKEVNRCFYFWKTNTEGRLDASIMDSVQVDKMYLHLFDVVPDAAKIAVPNGSLSDQYKKRIKLKEDSIDVVPVVYIVNKTFKGMGFDDCSWLARKVKRKVEDYLLDYNELQIDCDWSLSTKDKYFYFLSSLDSLLDERTLSVTIRLHQIKYQEETGVPPVDRGVLMFYNMSKLTDINTKNSILDIEEGKKYINSNTNYPIPMDYALPFYRQGVLFRYEEFYSLIYDPPLEVLDSSEIFMKMDSSDWYSSMKDGYIGENYFREGDLLRIEESDQEDILEAIDLIKQIDVPNDTVNVIFYNWVNNKVIDEKAFLDGAYQLF